MFSCLFVLLSLQAPPLDLQLAREAVENQKFERAIGLLDSVLEIDSTHTEAHYLRGIALREHGRNPTLKSRLQRLLARSEEDFRFVVAKDSAFWDVLYQFAILKRYQNDLRQAITLAEAQLRHHPTLYHVPAGLRSFYWRFVVSNEPEDARAWLRAQSGSMASLFVGQSYEHQGMFDAAERIYQKHEEAEQTLALLAKARLDFARLRPEDGTRAVMRSISELQTKADAYILFDEVKTIASFSEWDDFNRIENLEEYQRYFTAFWNRRNPMPAAPYNARMAEHYRRLRIAEAEYLFNGFRSWFRSDFTGEEAYFPSTYELASDFTDRGIVLIRHGEPDDYTVGDANSWLYRDSTLVFHFAPTCLGQVCGVTEYFVPAPLGPTFQASLVGIDRLDAERRSIEYLYKGLSTDRHQWPSKTRHWDIPYVMGAFRGMDGRTLLEVYYEVPLQETVQISGPDSIRLEAGFSVNRSDWSQVSYIREQTLHARGAPPFVGRFQLDVPAESYRFGLHARVLGGVHLQAIRFERMIPEFTETNLELSDLFLADSLDALPEARIREDLKLYVNPSGIFSRSSFPVVYFEIYNLKREADGQTNYRVAYTLAPINKPQQGVVTLQISEQRGSETSPISFIAIDFQEALPGNYMLEVEVEDLVSGRVVKTSRTLSLE